MVNSTWKYKGKIVKDINPSYQGFVYCITEKKTGMKYIGYKKAFSTGKRNKGKETNWKTYVSSSAKLKGMDVNNPKKFSKDIVYFGTNQTDLRVCEMYLLLFYYMNDRWEELYNENVNIRLRIRKGKQFNSGEIDEYLRVFTDDPED